MATIRIAQYFSLTTFASDKDANLYGNGGGQQGLNFFINRGQNYFIGETKQWNGEPYGFVPFRAEGSVANLNGDNSILQLLLPNDPLVLRLVERGNGNRLSRLLLTTVWLTDALNVSRSYEERYVGVGCSYSETTIELRFRSAMDSVGAQFPSRKLTRNLAGILPISADISMQ